MGSKERIHRLKENTKVNIINAAHEIVKEEGWQALSMRKIAEKIEYTAPMIYEYYTNKEGILLELTKKGYLLLGERMKEARDKYETPEEQLDAIWLAYWNFAFEEKEYYQLMFGLGIPTCETVSKIPAMKDFNEVITSSIVAMVPEGKPMPFDPFLKYQSFWSMLHGLVSINMTSLTNVSGTHPGHEGLPQQVLEDVLCSFIRGIQSAGQPAEH